MEKTNTSMGKTFGERVKNRAKQVWNWTKDHAVPLALGAAATAGGAYLLLRNRDGNTEVQQEPVQYYGQDPEMNERIHEMIDDHWPDPAESVGPDDDYPTEDLYRENESSAE